jgi:hypothetical protein
MPLTLQFDLETLQRDRDTLADVIGCAEPDLDQHFANYAKAATEEYIDMFLGKNAFKRANDFIEFRIYLLIIHVLGGRLPDEAFVSRYFQLSPSESRARIRGVTAKFQRGLSRQIKASIREILAAANHEEGDDTYQIAVNNQTIIDMLNSTLADIDGNLSAVSKVRGTVAGFSMPRASFVALQNHYA